MTKKIFAMFLAVLMVVSMLPASVFAANECPGKDSPKHSTSNCDYTVVKVTDPTCGTDGHTSYKCNVCGYTFAEKTADATGEHSYVAGEGKAPTCVEPGYEAGLICEVCGDEKPGKEIPALGKDGTDSCEWELVSGYDCDDKNGKLVYKCAFCGDVEEIARKDLGDKDPRNHEIYWGQYVAISATQAAFFCIGALNGQGCSYYVVADIKNAHDCDDYLYTVDKVEATCTTDGMKAYEQCRVCNTKYGYVKALGKYTYLTAENIEEEYVIKASHTFAVDPTCADTLMQCTVCNKYVNPGVEHDIDWVVEDAEKAEGAMLEPATCTKPGYIYDVCANCHVRHLQILEATGHNEITVTLPSTCGTYAYTFTYCTNENCDAPALSDLATDFDATTGLTTVVYDDNGMAYNVMVPALALVTTEAKLAKGFLLGEVQENLGKTLYFNGEMDGNYLATTTNPAEAVTLYLEKLENFRDRYLVYFVNEDEEKVYINVTEYLSGSYYKAKVSLTTETPDAYFTWDATRGILIAHGENDFYFLGTYNNYDTISASSSYYIDKDKQFKAMPYGMVAKSGVHMTGFTFDVKGGYNAEEHVYDIELGSIVLPTCTKAGSYDMVCVYCFDTVTVELAAGCANNLIWASEFSMIPDAVPATATDLEAAGIKNEAPSAGATCTTGAYQYFKCTKCGEVFKLTLSAPLGHHMSVWHDDTALLGHNKVSGYIGYDCEFCNYSIKLETLSWKNANKLYDSVDEAAADHGAANLEFVQLSKNGNCAVTGIELWKCKDCGKNVRIKQWQEIDGVKYPTGEHAGHRDNHQDPTCAVPGFHTTYQCARCELIIGNKELGQTEDLKVLDHTFVEINLLGAATLEALGLEEYEAAPCDEPNYNNVKYICVNCLTTKGDGTKVYRHEDLADCKGNTIEVYKCHCGEYHIRALGSYDHKWNMVPAVAVGDKREDGSKVKAGDSDITYQAPTCYQYGWFTVECEYCNARALQPIAPAAHENAAGEKFTDSCLDEVTDRHCVVCCEYFDHARFGADHKNCTLTHKEGKKDVYDCLTQYHTCTKHDATCAVDCTAHCGGFPACLAFIDDGCQVPSFCHFELKENRPSTCVEDAHYLQVCADCKTEKMVSAEINKQIVPAGVKREGVVFFYGHKPVSSAATLANYTYLNLLYQEVDVVDGAFVLDKEYIYNAEFIEYVAPTFNAEGYAKFYCEHCDAVVEQNLPKLAGMGFELDVKNANGAKEFTYGSLVEVIVSINGNEGKLNSFEFAVFAGFQYVGYETLNNELFNITVTNPAKNTNYAVISGVAANTADGKMQNIEITEKTQLVKLYFRINNPDFVYTSGVSAISFLPTEVKAWVSGTTTKDIAVNFLASEIKVRQFLDLDKNGVGSTSDLSLALTLLTGEHPKGATYDVTVDMNKDGVVTLEDLSIAHNLLVDNIDLEDVLYMGMSEAEIEIFENQKTHYCVNCGYAGITSDMKYCPECGRNPHAK